MSNSTNTSGQIDFTMWLLRLVAYVIDAIIIGIVVYVIDAIIAVSIVLTGGFFLFVGYGLFLLFFGLLSILYFIILDVVWGATIGKRLLGFDVQQVKSGRVTFGQSFVRNISKIFFPFLFLDWVIAVVTAGNDRRQKLTDRWAGTTVAQVRQPFESMSSQPSQPTQQPPAPPPPST